MALSWKSIKELAGTLISNWAFTDKGIAVFTAVWAAVMGALTYFTHALAIFAPLSYGLAAALGIILGLHICRLINQAFSERFTTKPTFVEYKIENRRINLVKRQNIYKEPSCILMDQPEVTLTPQIQQPNRQQRRAAQSAGQELPIAQGPTLIIPQNLSVRIVTHFQIPISPSAFHVHVESIVGQAPTRESSSIDERWCDIVLSNIPDSCSFRIRFTQNDNP